jgi:GNAT superfamily N-acetyltransferase
MAHIRLATVEDIPVLVAMGKRFHSKTVYGDIAPLDDRSLVSVFDRLIAGDKGVLFVAGDDALTGALGAIITTPWFNTQCPLTLELFWWVDPEARRSGAGSALFDAINAWWPPRSRGLYMLRTPNIKPEVMDRFYRRRGFRVWDQYYLKMER